MPSITIAANEGLVTLQSTWRAVLKGITTMVGIPTVGTGALTFDLSGIPKGATVNSASLSCQVQVERGEYLIAGRKGNSHALSIPASALQSGKMSVGLSYQGQPAGDERGLPLPGKLYMSFCAFRGGSLTVNYTVSSGGGGGGGVDIGQSGGLIHAVPPGGRGRILMLYPAGEWDFSRNGTALRPVEARVEEEENGNFSASVTLPMDNEGLWRRIGYRDILRIPCPARATLAAGEDIESQIYDQYTPSASRGYIYLYSAPTSLDGESRNLGRVDNGSKLLKISETQGLGGTWYRVTSAEKGITGYCSAASVELLSDGTTISSIKTLQDRDQLFRIYEISADLEGRTVQLEARHIFYDLSKAILVGKDANMEKISVHQALERLSACSDHPVPFHFFSDCAGEITGDFRGKNLAEALLDPESGIASQCQGFLCRDNFDVYLLKDPGEDRGVRIQHGRNCLGARCTWASETAGNRIIALMGDQYSIHDDPNRPEDEEIITVFRQYDKKDGTAAEQAEKEFSSGLRGIDLEMDVNFILLSETALYRRYAGLQALFLGDTVHLSIPQGTFDARSSGYIYNPLLRQYEEMHIGVTAAEHAKGSVPDYKIGKVSSGKLIGQLQGHQLGEGIVTAEKIDAEAITVEKLAAGAVAAEKIAAGAVTAEKIGADAIGAENLRAGAVQARHIDAGAVSAEKLAAEAVQAKHLSTDALSAVDAHIVNAEINWAEIESLQAAIADITSAEIQNADIDFAKIKDLSADSAIITKGVGGELYISRLAVTEANLVSLSVGQLMVKGADGAFYAISVDDAGNIKAEKKMVGNADIGDQTINAGEKLIEGSVTAHTLNAREIFGDSALIRQLIAANLDVDTLFAREAMISKLNALDITGNESIRIYVQRQDEMNAFLRVTENGLEIGKVGDPAIFRADNRTLEVTNVKTERLGVTQRMAQNEEWAFAAYGSGLSIKWIGGDV